MARAVLGEFAIRRTLNGLSAPVERPTLDWLSERMPAWVKPDHLTYLGLCGGVLTGLSLAATAFSPLFIWLAVVGLSINWFGDSLDGTIARKRKIERPRYGFFIDYTTDLATQICIAIGIGLSPFMRLDVACLMLTVYLALSILMLANLFVTREMQLTVLRIGPTEIRIAIAVALIAAFFTGPGEPFDTFLGPFNGFDLAALGFCVIATVSACLMTHRNLKRLALIDPPRLHGRDHLTETVMHEIVKPNIAQPNAAERPAVTDSAR